MAEGDAEKRNISRLDFNINDAINSLDLVEKKLKTISEQSEKYASNISKNIKSGITINVDSKEVQQNFKEIENFSKKTQEQLVKNAQKSQLKQSNIAFQEEEKRKTIAYKAALNQQKYNDMVEKSTKSMYDKITGYAKTYLIYQGFNELKRGISETIDEMVEMENQMVAIDRVLNEDSLNIDKYRDKLVQLAYDYGNSFNNVADITLRLAQAGFDSQEAIALTEKTLLALNTAELDATQATDDMVAVMAQWGLMTGTATEQAQSYGNIIDKINKIADNFPTTSADIMDALKKVSSAFNLAGASIDETIATIVAAEKASQRGGKVIGTALSNITQQLKAEGKLNLAEQLGLNFYTDDAKTTFKPIMEIFQEMAERMEQLKNEGKDSSVEMQSLLELFTVFRRNVGASLLGEMSGEDNTYLQALEMSIDSVGYSLQENEKYMRTAKAAQAQFNAELLKLKTQVWDDGLESVFREMLSKGTDILHFISDILDKFGVVPTSIGAIIAAYTVLSNKVKIQDIGKLTVKIKEVNAAIQASKNGLKAEDEVLKGTSKTFQNYAISVKKGEVNLGGYAANVVKTTAETALLTAGTIALNAALSFGLSAAITFITSQIDNWIHAEEKAIEKANELKDTAIENASKLNNEVKTYQDLQTELEETVKQYNELKNAKKDTGDTEKKLYELQAQINSQMKETGKQVNIIKQDITEQGKKVQVVNDKYEEQLDLIKSIAYEKKRQQVEELKTAMEQAQKVAEMKTIGSESGWNDFWGASGSGYSLTSDLQSVLGTKQVSDFTKGSINIKDAFDKLDFGEKIKTLEEWIDALNKAANGSDKYSGNIEFLQKRLAEYKTIQKDATEATNNYIDALGELYAMSGQLDTFNTFLDSIDRSYNLEGPKELISQLKGINQEFSDGTINVEEYFNKIEEKIQEIDLEAEGEELEAYQAIFAATSATLAEGVESLMSGITSGAINFTEYAEGIKEIADNTIDLAFKGEEANTEYLDTLASARDELAQYSSVLDTIGESYDFIAEHANSAGEAMFKQADETSEAYQTLATNLTNTLNNLKDNSEMAFKTITNSIAQNIEDSTNDMYDAEGYLSQGFLDNYANMNTALNVIKSDAEKATNQTTRALGNVFKTLGETIEKFEYKITGTPTITGTFGLQTDKFGIPIGIKLPTFGFNITGEAGGSAKGLADALKTYGEGVTTTGNIKFAYDTLANSMANNGRYTAPSRGSSGGSSQSSKSGGGGSSSKSTTTDNSDKEAEQQYKANLKAFKDFFEERERLEKRWVTKQKDLGQLETDDFLYITEQRIKRYEQYLEAIKNATWLNAEDRLELEKKYTEGLEDLQVDYLEYLKDKLDEEVKAIEDANKEKIQAIKDEAQKRIDALKKVEKETDRIREKEEYERKRAEHLEDISYWEQRTGREAQERLKEARANLEELDREWEEKQQDWSIEDQIKAIEDERDAQVKAIEDAQQAEIDAMKAVYDAKVKMFAETGEIIYENSVMQSQNLYNAYKKNFIDPVTSDLSKLNQTLATNVTESSAKSNEGASENKVSEPEQQYETYKIKSGDTLTKIARQYDTTIEKILEANPYVTNKNKIYTGKTLQIPKFHEGGIVGGNTEGFALLKPNEVVLRPDWAEGITKLAKMARQKENAITTNSTVIEVKGDLVKLEASVKDKTDVEYLTRRIEKALTDKFNIKK